ncbi:glycosyltransferase family 4 protein [Candidatus Pacearchaeota archaeon]|nr:glycosyltransferase family 4 protein [Candidatus Pacearchaeota archaeon]
MNQILLMGMSAPQEGGSERHVYELASRIKESTVFTQRGSICQRTVQVPVPTRNILLRNLCFLFWAVLYALFLLITLRKKYTTIHIHENLLYVLAPLLRMRYTVVITIHGMTGFLFHDSKLLWLFFKQGLRAADALIAVNPVDERVLHHEFPGKKIKYFPNGVDLDAYKGRAHVEKKIVFIGRIHEQKGIVYLLEAFTSLEAQIPGFKLEIIGKLNDYAIELQRKYPSQRILWRGFIANRDAIARTLESAYCIVLPSLWEGLPLTLFESLASGRPIIVSKIDAFSSVVKNEVIFFKSKNSSDLGKKLLEIVRDKKRAARIGAAGKKTAGRYDWNRIAQEYSAFMQSL